VLVDLAQRINHGQPVDLAMGHFNTVWQGDANAMALAALDHVSTPPWIVNVTGPRTFVVGDLTEVKELVGNPIQDAENSNQGRGDSGGAAVSGITGASSAAGTVVSSDVAGCSASRHLGLRRRMRVVTGSTAAIGPRLPVRSAVASFRYAAVALWPVLFVGGYCFSSAFRYARRKARERGPSAGT
jgi:hypothetical protein